MGTHRTRPLRRIQGLALLLAVSVTMLACGSDSDGSPDSAASKVETPAARSSEAAVPAPSSTPDAASEPAPAGPEAEAAAPAAGPSSPTPTPGRTGTATPATTASKSAPGKSQPTAGAGDPATGTAPKSSASAGPSTPAPAGGGQATPAAPGGSPAPAAPPSGGVIKIGGINPLSGGLSLIGKPAEQAARAYFRKINETGGVLGQKIEYIVEDDAGDANRSRAAAEKLIEKDRIFLMGPSFTPYSPDLVPFVESKGVPFIGWDATIEKNGVPLASPSTVTLAAGASDLAAAMSPYWMKKTGIKKIGIIYTEFGPAVTLRDETKRQAKKLGVEVVKEIPVNQQTNFFVPLFVEMQRAEVDGIAFFSAADIFLKGIVQAREMDYKPKAGFISTHGTTNDLVAESCGSYCDGMLVPWFLWPHQVSNPAIDEMKATVSKYYGEINHDLFTELAYVGAKAVVDTLTRAGAVDRAKVLEAARGLTAYDSGGFHAGPIDISPGKTHSGRGVVLMRAEKGKWVKESDWLVPQPAG